MKLSYFIGQAWRWARWVLLVLILAFITLVIYRLPYAADEQKTQQMVAEIHATKLTREDVLGTLPPPPDKTLNASTVAGIDANHNGIRDDVEIAIYNAHKDSASVTAAEYQYAMAIQLMLIDVYNTDTWVAAAEENSRAEACIGLTVPNNDLVIFTSRIKEVENLMLNTTLRKNANDAAYKFTTSYALPNADLCNVDLGTLPN